MLRCATNSIHHRCKLLASAGTALPSVTSARLWVSRSAMPHQAYGASALIIYITSGMSVYGRYGSTKSVCVRRRCCQA